MSEIVKDFKKKLIENMAITNFLKLQLNASEKEDKNLKGYFYNAVINEINDHIEEIHPDFKSYLSKTIANFRTLDQCYYYENTQDTDLITIKHFLRDVISSGTGFGRASITLPSQGLPKKAFIKFFAELGIKITERKTGMSIFIQDIPKAKGDKKKYVCLHMNFRNL